MSDLEEFLADDGPAVRQLTFKGKTIDVHFRRISASQKAELLKGQTVQAAAGKTSTYEIDLGENAKNKMLMVFYSVANPDGSQHFKKLEQVRAIDNGKVDALYKLAVEVNKDEDDAGKD